MSSSSHFLFHLCGYTQEERGGNNVDRVTNNVVSSPPQQALRVTVSPLVVVSHTIAPGVEGLVEIY